MKLGDVLTLRWICMWGIVWPKSISSSQANGRSFFLRGFCKKNPGGRDLDVTGPAQELRLTVNLVKILTKYVVFVISCKCIEFILRR
jgi:hypothetical protein